MTEKKAFAVSGFWVLALICACIAAAVRVIVVAALNAPASPVPTVAVVALLLLLVVILSTGLVIVQPNYARVVTFFGRYMGTLRRNGFCFTCPLTQRDRISLRVRNFDSSTLKVNDANGNPIEVAAVVVWRVVDTAKAAFEVDDYEQYVQIQAETAIRHMAALYPYEAYEEGKHSLRGNAEEVMIELQRELQVQLMRAGVEALRTQLRRLAYAPEIAADMLRRQQAEAVVAARQRIVEGAVGMVQHALELLAAGNVVELDGVQRAAMVSNLLVVLCGESHTQPVVNAGTLATG